MSKNEHILAPLFQDNAGKPVPDTLKKSILHLLSISL